MEKGKADSGIYVTLSYSPLGLIGAKATGIAQDGMSVDTGAIGLPHHAEVEVTLSYRRGRALQVHRLSALVADRTPRGTQLLFQDVPPETAGALEELRAAEQTAALEGVA